ncbi:hypothetical protein TGAM01_v200129 [Trichoderma gamsii]|uniref:Uncharacterized protein n=1 Tax=Trichoderma gamsii TaxID=398673 RepID=A0A2P5A2E6_9HYPO|nr:hypothetical protein TGAM01_v200129 [Trichoderma gamsii]PON30709.1 hypothetical protein TGAM01_v200129 [Trichoderma gamsii]
MPSETRLFSAITLLSLGKRRAMSRISPGPFTPHTANIRHWCFIHERCCASYSIRGLALRPCSASPHSKDLLQQ